MFRTAVAPSNPSIPVVHGRWCGWWRSAGTIDCRAAPCFRQAAGRNSVTPPTKKWPSPRWISSEGGLGITLCLLSFTNLLSVFRLLLGNTGQWAEIAFGLSVLAISVLFWLLTVWKYHVQISKFSFAVAAFFAYSVFRFVAAGVPISFMWVFVIEGWVAWRA